jgi:dipeptidase E
MMPVQMRRSTRRLFLKSSALALLMSACNTALREAPTPMPIAAASPTATAAPTQTPVPSVTPRPRRKLVLYSAQGAAGSAPVDARMRALLTAKSPRVGWVPTMVEDDGQWYRDKVPYYKALGIALEPYVKLGPNTTPDQIKGLLACDGIHLSGGWTPGLLMSLRDFKLLDALRDFVARGGVLIGESAGSIVMTPHIQTCFFLGQYADGYPGQEMDYNALNLTNNWTFWPHYRPEDEEKALAFGKKFKIDFYAAEDGGAVVVDGDTIEAFGPVRFFKSIR